MRQILILGITFLLLLNISQSWLSGWQYRIPITIKENSGNNLTDYQVLITINTSSLISQGKMRSDCGDIRFTDSDGRTLINYWIESGCNSANTRIWIKVPNIPASGTKTIYLYYGNPSATSMSNGDLVFDFFDDFLGTSLNTSKWSTSGTVSVSGGIVEVYNTGSNVGAELRTIPTFRNKNIRIYGRYLQDSGGAGDWAHTMGLGLAGRQTNAWGLARDSNDPDGYHYLFISGSKQSSFFVVVPRGQWGIWDLRASANMIYVDVYKDGFNEKWGSFNRSFNVADANFTYVFHRHTYPSGTWARVRVDYTFVARFVDPEPTYTLGSEETITITINIDIISPRNTTYFTSQINFSFVVNISSNKLLNTTIQSYLNNNLQTSDSYNNIYSINYSKTFSLNLSENVYNFTVLVLTNYANRTQSVIFTTYLGYDFYLVDENYNFISFNASVNNTNYRNIRYLHLPPGTYNVLLYINRTNEINELSSIIIAPNDKNYNITLKLPKINLYAWNYYNNSWQLESNYILNETIRITADREFNTTYANITKSSINKETTFSVAINSLIEIFSKEFLFNTYQTRAINVFDIDIYNCTSPNLKFYVKDEENKADLTLNYSLIEIDFSLYHSNYKKHKAIENSLNICFYPNFSRLVYENRIVATFRKDNYALAEYYSYTPVIVNFFQTSSITTYMLSNAYALPIKFTLPDSNYYLVVERKRDSNFEFIRSTKSDFNKNALIYLRPYDVFYRVSVFDSTGNLCFASEEFKLVQSEYSITSCIKQAITNITLVDVPRNVNITCYLVNNVYTCDFMALDSQDHQVEIYVYKIMRPWGSQLYYYNKTTAVSGSFQVALSNGTYEIKVIAHSLIDFVHDIIQIGEGVTQNPNILYFFLIISVAMALIGAYNILIGLFGQIMLTILISAFGGANIYTFGISGMVILFILGLYFIRR